MQLNLQTGTRGNTIHFLFFGNERETLYTLYTLREAREILSSESRTSLCTTGAATMDNRSSLLLIFTYETNNANTLVAVNNYLLSQLRIVRETSNKELQSQCSKNKRMIVLAQE